MLVGDVTSSHRSPAGEVLRACWPPPARSPGPADEDLPPSPAVQNRDQRQPGQRPPPSLRGFPDFFWFICEDTEQTADIVARRIPRRFGMDPRRDIQVLAPMHRGSAGAGNLNTLLQERLTPHQDGNPERRYGSRVFRVCDKVTQLRNNYDKGAASIFNGTIGIVTARSPDDGKLTVLTDEDESMHYGFEKLDELAHAYAVTIHRSQAAAALGDTTLPPPRLPDIGCKEHFHRCPISTVAIPRSSRSRFRVSR
jgi:exodeoxyribonuclease V alpha subunit